MLGKLFNLASGSPAGASTQPPPTSKSTPESVLEEIHTRSLLFPGAQQLFQGQDQVFPLSTASTLPPSHPSLNAFDYDGEIELDVRDVRVIIMQDSLGTVNPCLLFDSHPAPPMPAGPERQPAGAPQAQTLVQDLRRNPTSARKTSLNQSARPVSIQQDNPQPRLSAFDRRSSIQTRPYAAETEAQRVVREYREELASFSGCIFANTEVMSYKGTSTKVHVVPGESRASDTPSPMGDGRGSMGRTCTRSSKLAQSFTSESAATPSAPAVPQNNQRKILVTRLFPVNLPVDEVEPGVTPQGPLSDDGSSYPFPYSPDDSNMRKRKALLKQKRTPMYAVALVLQLPRSKTTPPATFTKPLYRTSGVGQETEPLSSSYNSAFQTGWAVGSPGDGADAVETGLQQEDHMETVTRHWDIVMRTLTHLQSVVATSLFSMLKQTDYASPDPYVSVASFQSAQTPSLGSRRGSNASMAKPPKTNNKLVALTPNCLMPDQDISREIDVARTRIVTGLKATRVVTGQGRWGPWRDEARWVAKWAGGKEQGFFFFNLLTGFLATHTEWLQALSPLWYRQQYYKQHKDRIEEVTALPSRTIIVSNDKMAARRLVFLISAFLPSSNVQPLLSAPVARSSASASFSQSPPYIVPLMRSESLRRKINRRPAAPRGPSHQRSYSIQSQLTTRSITGIPAQLTHLSMDAQRQRRPSDAVSLRRASNLLMPGSDLSIRKCSAATTNAVMPDAAIPHFSTVHHDADVRRTNRPGSSSSTAADDLKRALQRGDGTSHSTQGSGHTRRSSNWGSMISGLWSTKRRNSAATSRTMNFDSPESPMPSPIKPATPKDKITHAGDDTGLAASMASEEVSPRNTFNARANQPETPQSMENRTPARQIEPSAGTPDPARAYDPLGAFESPVKTSINADDGIIDVDVQFPDYLASFESAISSPSSSGYLSNSGLGHTLDSFDQFSMIAVDSDRPLNVAGWLQNYHPDFALQAIPPQANLLDEVKASLMAEPTPTVPLTSSSSSTTMTAGKWPSERWIDVSTAIVADTTTFTIKRLRFRRLVRPKMQADRYNSNSAYPFQHCDSSFVTPAVSPYEQPIKEKIEEDVLVSLDEALIEAIEKVIAQPTDNSHASRDALGGNPSGSKRRERSDSDALQLSTAAEVPAITPAHGTTRRAQDIVQEVPRAECKTVILDALGSIVQAMVEEREGQEQRQSKQEQQRSKQPAPAHGSSSNAAAEVDNQPRSVLQGTVRAWLDMVEMEDRERERVEGLRG